MGSKFSGLLLLILIAPVFATVSNGPYAGIELGGANQINIYQSSIFNIDTGGTQLSNSNWGFLGRFNLGYNINKNNGFELGSNYFFSTTSAFPGNNGSMTTNTTAIDLSYIGYLPISQSKLSIFGRIGLAYDWINNSNSTGCSCNTQTSGLQPSGSNFADVIGAGIKYNYSAHTSFRTEWISNGLFFPVGINSGTQNIASWSAQTFLAGINYHF